MGFPSTTMSIAEAEVDLLSSHVFKTTFVKYKVSVLQVLCARHSITVTPTGRSSSPLKQDYVDALNTYKVSCCVAIDHHELSTHQRTREAEARSSEQQLLEVHLIGGPKDWIVLKKIWYQWRTGEDIDLVALAGRFGEKNKLCYVSDRELLYTSPYQ